MTATDEGPGKIIYFLQQSNGDVELYRRTIDTMENIASDIEKTKKISFSNEFYKYFFIFFKL